LGCVGVHIIAQISWVAAVALALPTGALLVRVFIVQHDYGHDSFFASKRANKWAGRACSLLTLTPFANWGHQHGLHRADWYNLDGAGSSDIYSACLAVDEYQALSHWQYCLYRLPRHPLIANVLLPPLVFVLLYRVPFDTPRERVRERWSVHLANVPLVCVFGTLVVMLGWQQVLLVHLSTMVMASILGVWLFSLQHRSRQRSGRCVISGVSSTQPCAVPRGSTCPGHCIG
jgi:acyl-lipid omega-6 desaturase (Delta-12 desaturase)